MSRDLRFGIMTLQNLPWPTLVEYWKQVEDLGFDSLWTGDHFVNPYDTPQNWYEGWTLLAGMALETSRIRVGALVTNFALRNPAMLARQAMTLDHMSGGRLDIGLGAGGPHDPSYPMIDIEVWAPPERVARFRETVEIVDRLLRNEETTYQGRYYTVNGAAMNPRPVQQPRPPFTIAANGSSMLKIAARYADTWNTYLRGGYYTDEGAGTIRERNSKLDDYCAQLGRDPGEIVRSLLVFTLTPADSPFRSVQTLEDLVGRYREAGVNEFIFYYPPETLFPVGTEGDYYAAFEEVAREVIPRMKGQQASPTL
jgi:alkanesulfonate monooxygenase SsuD/methylene tetrahydromethanopterin reductase-like flavin-dependent oxidoreductase (luciferase family)